MKRSFLFLFPFLLGAPQASIAFPRIIAKKILERPGDANTDFEVVNQVGESIIKGAEEIRVHEIEVGNPPVTLNVLAVKPRDYGFEVTGGAKKNEAFRFGISISYDGPTSREVFSEVLGSEKMKEFEEKGSGEMEAKPAEVIRMFESYAGLGDQNRVPEKSKTIFFLNGLGVSNRTSMGWALILAKNGYEVIAPDLRGLAASGGRGPTYGKHEVADLSQLLTDLRGSGAVTGKQIGVIGISYGAAMASLWAGKDPRVESTVLIAPYAKADETMLNALKNYKENFKFPFPLTPQGVRKGTEIAERKLGVTWESISPARAIPSVGHPILFITSSGDQLVPPAVVNELYETAPKGSSFKSYEGIPHEVLGYNVDVAAPLILDWFDDHFP